MDNFIKANNGSYYAPLQRWILSGRVIPLNKLRVVDPCFAEGTCPGSPRTPNARARIAGVAGIGHLSRGGHGHSAEMQFARH
jgi:hypothetical protein